MKEIEIMKESEIKDSEITPIVTSANVNKYLKLFPKKWHDKIRNIVKSQEHLRMHASQYLPEIKKYQTDIILARQTKTPIRSFRYLTRYPFGSEEVTPIPYQDDDHAIEVRYFGESYYNTYPWPGRDLEPRSGMIVLFHHGLPVGNKIKLEVLWSGKGTNTEAIAIAVVPARAFNPSNSFTSPEGRVTFEWTVVNNNDRLLICITNHDDNYLITALLGYLTIID